MKRKDTLPKNFFSINRKVTKKETNEEYSEIQEIQWGKDILTGKNKIVASLPKSKKILNNIDKSSNKW